MIEYPIDPTGGVAVATGSPEATGAAIAKNFAAPST